jgi:hypothetical protein
MERNVATHPRKRSISRQRLWQLKQKASRLCTKCGDKLSDTSVNFCERCRLNINAYYRASRRVRY